MANEFIARNGLIAKAASVVSGSLTVTGGNIVGNLTGTVNGSSPLSGTGTANYIAQWDGTSSIANSGIYVSSGNVGIGTTSPTAKLHVVGNAYIDGTLTAQEFKTEYITQTIIFESGSTAFGNSDDDTHNYVGLLNVSGSTVPHVAIKSDAGNLPGLFLSRGNGTFSSLQNSTWYLANSDNGLEIGAGDRADGQTTRNVKLQIDNNGNVGIGVTTPVAKLQVNGAVWANEFVGDGSQLTGISATAGAGGTTGQVQFNFVGAIEGASGLYYDYSNARVGIGTSTPTESFEVHDGNIKLQDGIRSLLIGEEGSSSYQIKSSGWLILDATTGIQLNKTTSGNVLILNGNVGIGTNTPTRKLDISANANDGIKLAANNALIGGGATGGDTQLIYWNGSIAYYGRNSLGGSIDQHEFRTGGATRLVINSSGNVGIGTTTPSYKLHVEGTSYFSNLSIFNNNVGIGTTTPDYKLDVDVNAATGSGAVYPIRISGGTMSTIGDATGLLFQQRGSDNDYGGYVRLYTTASTPSFLQPRLEFGVQNYNTNVLADVTTKMVITGGGNVGIGTVNPTALLNVVSATQNASALVVEDDARKVKIGRDQIQVTDLSDAASTMYLQPNSNIVINSNAGNVGIGTQPSYKLDVLGSTRTTGDHLALGSLFFRNDTAGDGVIIRDIDWRTTAAEGTDDRLGVIRVYTSAGTTTTRGGQMNFYTRQANSANFNTMIFDRSGNLYVPTNIYANSQQVATQTWVTSQISGFSTDLDGVTTAGNTTTNSITVGGLTSTGNIDVTKNTPLLTLGTGNITTGNAKIVLNSGNNGTYNTYFIQYTKDTGVDRLDFIDGGGTAKISFVNGGNVGIGTTTPSTRLHVAGGRTYLQTVNEIYTLGISRSGANAYYLGISSASSPDLYFSNNAGTTRVTFTDAGNVGIGTITPLDKLTVAGGHISVSGVGNKLYFDTTNATKQVILGVENDYEFHMVNARGNSSRFILGNSYVSLGTSSTKLLFINTSNGYTGIGTDNPTQRLHVVGNPAEHPIIKVEATGAGYAARYSLQTTTREWRLGTHSTQNDNFWVYDATAGEYRFVVDTNGNVGIGTDTPATKLQVYGAIRGFGLGHYFGDYLMSYSNAVLAGMSTAPTSIPLVAKGTNGQTADLTRWVDFNNNILAVVNNYGNIGVGTATPTAQLHVVGSIKADFFGNGSITYGGDKIQFNDPIGLIMSPSAGTGELNIGYNANNWNEVKVSANNFFYNDNEVATQAWVTAQGYGAGSTSGTGTANYLTKWTNTTTLGASVIYDNGTNVGIGTTSPLEKLHVNGAIKLDQSPNVVGNGIAHHTNGYLYVTGGTAGAALGNDSYSSAVYAVDNGSLELYAGSSNRLHITSGGNVGIGTTSPSYKLDVSGQIRVDNGLGNGSGQAVVIGGSGDVTLTSGGSLFFGAYDYGSSTYIRGYDNSAGLYFYADGTLTMNVAGNGNVGIGTTSPTQKLDVTDGDFVVRDAAGVNKVTLTRFGGIELRGNGTGYRTVGTPNTDALSLATNNLSRLYITSGGNVLIGTTSDAGYKLRVNGNSYQDGAATFASTVYVGGTLTAAGNTNITGDLTVGGTVTAQEFRTEYITQTIIYESGSTAFGNTYDDTHIYTGSLSIYGSGSTVLDVQGSQGQLFSVTDSLEGTLMSVNDISGLPILEVTSDDKVIMGTYNQNTLVVNGDKVGIGTATPTAKLQVGPEAHPNATGIEVAAGTSGANLLAIDNANNHNWFPYVDGQNYYSAAAHTFRNATHNVDWMHINSSGNVGIGTTNPLQTLHVSGQRILVDATNAGIMFRTGGVNRYSVASVDGDFQVYDEVNSLNRFNITSAGNVGIGTTSPSYKLHVDGGNTGSSLFVNGYINGSAYGQSNRFVLESATRLWFYDSNAQIYRDSSTLKLYGNDGIAFETGGTEKVRITNGGNVGIGTTSPNSVLHVGSTGANAYSSTITSGSNMKGIITALSNNADDMVGIYFATGTNTQGTHWSGITGARSQSATDWSTQLNFYTHDENLSDINNATQKMVIKGNGNVGIGTTSPYSLLQVGNPEQVTPAELTIASRYDGGGPILNFRTDHPNNSNQWNMARIVATDDGNYNGRLEFRTTTAGGYLGNEPLTRMTIKATGNVGIGTMSPNHKLDIYADTNVPLRIHRPNSALDTTEPVGIGFSHRGDTATSTTDTRAGIFSSYNGDLFLSVDAGGRVDDDPIADSALFIEGANKYVGIGTTSPVTKLEVNGTFKSIGIQDSSTSQAIFINGNAEVGIGTTSPTTALQVVGRTKTSELHVSNSDAIYTNTGNVGIGTTSPSSKLHVVGTTTSDGNIVPSDPGAHDLGQPDVRWRTVFCDILDSAGVHEANLATGNVEELATGTVLVWKNGKNVPCTVEGDHMRMGVAVNGIASPLVQGAEPVLVTGTVNEGDYLITSEVIGHAKAISRAEMLERNLYDCVLGKALESGSGSSYLLKTWITI